MVRRAAESSQTGLIQAVVQVVGVLARRQTARPARRDLVPAVQQQHIQAGAVKFKSDRDTRRARSDDADIRLDQVTGLNVASMHAHKDSIRTRPLTAFGHLPTVHDEKLACDVGQFRGQRHVHRGDVPWFAQPADCRRVNQALEVASCPLPDALPFVGS